LSIYTNFITKLEIMQRKYILPLFLVFQIIALQILP